MCPSVTPSSFRAGYQISLDLIRDFLYAVEQDMKMCLLKVNRRRRAHEHSAVLRIRIFRSRRLYLSFMTKTRCTILS
jgi:hypothetical protein